MSVVTDLQEARELILKEEHWTQKVFAVNASGCKVSVNDPTACKWCATGALEKITHLNADNWDRHDRARQFLNVAALELFTSGPITVNDTLGHKATIEMFDEAIERAKNAGN